MKLLLSINYKFYEVNMKGLFDLIDKDVDKIIGGIELNIRALTDKEKKFATLIAKKLKERDLKLQIHATELSMDVLVQYEFLKLYNGLSNIMEEKIQVVYHPYLADNVTDSIYITTIILKRLRAHIEDRKYNLSITLENLEDVDGRKNLKMEQVEKVLKNLKDVNITYDIGHEVLENICKYNINSRIRDRIKNVHIHDISQNNIPHFPTYSKKIDLDKTFKMLKDAKYDGDVVLEIALDYLRGNTYLEKLDEYLNEAKKINEYKVKYFN